MAKILDAGEQIGSGERKTAEFLQGLPADWVVICNKLVPFRDPNNLLHSKQTREIDFIVIGDHVVFLIDDKYWKGPITGSDQTWETGSGRPFPNPINAVDLNARRLAGYIRDNNRRLKRYSQFVVGCVSLSHADTKPSTNDPRNRDQTFLSKDSVKHLLDLDKKYLNDLNKSVPGFHVDAVGLERTNISDLLLGLRQRPKHPRVINGFEIQLPPLPSPPHPRSKRYLGIHPAGDEREFTFYDIGFEADTEKHFYLTEFESIRQLGDTGLVPRVDPWFLSTDEQFLVIPSHIPSGIPYASVPIATDLKVRFEVELDRSIAIFSALKQIHSYGVIHRALNLYNVYFQEAETEYNIIFTGFWAARKANPVGLSIRQELNQLDLDDMNELINFTPFSAPELDEDYGFADETSDTYAVSKMLLSRLFDIPHRDLRDESVIWESLKDHQIVKVIGEEVSERARQFFEATLGIDPLIGNNTIESGRMTAQDCGAFLLDILKETRIIGNTRDDPRGSFDISLASGTFVNGPPVLTVVEGPDSGLKFVIDREVTTIGRRADNHLMLKDKKVSRVHAELIMGPEGIVIEDQGSTHGIYLNEVKVSSATINFMDVFRIGDNVIRLEQGILD